MSLITALAKYPVLSAVRSVPGDLSKCQAFAPLLVNVRWKKPRWVPKSKSKIFYVRKPTPIDQAEAEELRMRYAHYRTAVRAVRNYLIDGIQAEKEREKSMTSKRVDEEELAWLFEENRRWNEQSARFREEHLVFETEKKNLRLQKKMTKDQERKLQLMETAEQILKKDVEQSQSFITLENLDTEIEKLLNTRQDYNFAIDSQGRKITSSGDTSDPFLAEDHPKQKTDEKS